jgi:hypothetical protein
MEWLLSILIDSYRGNDLAHPSGALLTTVVSWPQPNTGCAHRGNNGGAY